MRNKEMPITSSDTPTFREIKGNDRDNYGIRVLSVEDMVDEKLSIDRPSDTADPSERYPQNRLTHIGGLEGPSFNSFRNMYQNGETKLMDDVELAMHHIKPGVDTQYNTDLDDLNSRVRRDEFTHLAIKERREELRAELARRRAVKPKIFGRANPNDDVQPVLKELRALEKYEQALPSGETIRKVADTVLENFSGALRTFAKNEAHRAGVEIVEDK